MCFLTFYSLKNPEKVSRFDIIHITVSNIIHITVSNIIHITVSNIIHIRMILKDHVKTASQLCITGINNVLIFVLENSCFKL